MANLINGNASVTGVTAQMDADFYEGLCGGVTGILPVGAQMAATITDNAPVVSDGVILTKEGRRIQIDYGTTDTFTIPTGTSGVTTYYIIGYKLTTDSSDNQSCEMFVQETTSTGTITENMLKDGNDEVYISLYRVTQSGTTNAIGDCLLPTFSPLSTSSSSGGSSSGMVSTYSATWKGLSVTVDVYDSALVFVNISGNTSSAITTKSTWATVGNYSSYGLTPSNLVEGYTEVNSIQSLRFYWGTDGIFKIGWGRTTATGEAANVSSGYVVNLHFSFAL